MPLTSPDDSTSSWLNILETQHAKDIELRRREASLVAMATLGVLFLTTLLLVNVDTYPRLLRSILWFSDVLLIATMMFYYKIRNIRFAGWVNSLITFGLNLLLVYSGGKQDTALYWVLFYPVAVFAILGVRGGSVLTLLLFFSAITMLYTPELILADYDPVSKSRFLMSYLCVSTLSFINEYFRSREHYETKSVSLSYKRDANTDPLTGIPNRRFLDSNYIKEHLFDESEQNTVVVMADIDRFKCINDDFGHDIGDEALVHTVDLLTTHIRQSDLLCRYGGEEFLICLPNSNLEQGRRIAEKLREVLEQTEFITSKGGTLHITCSFGVAQVGTGGFESAISRADKNLYKAKDKGRNLVIAD